MSILKSLSTTVITASSAVERGALFVDNLFHIGTNVSGAGVDVSEGWRTDILETAEISRQERRLNREERRAQLEPEEPPISGDPS